MGTSRSDEQKLDNPVWYALRDRHAAFAQNHPGGRAARFDPEVSVFGAVDHVDDTTWRAQADLVGAGGFAVLFRDRVEAPPAGWNEVARMPSFQMVAGDLTSGPEISPVELGNADVDEMLELVALTEPGPFAKRTVELGGYIGVRREGRLIAMAGQRFKLPGWTEVSAICTHPDARGEGLAGALTLCVAHAIRADGDEAFLHVLQNNESAVRLYRALGFEIRRESDAVAAQWVGTEAIA